METITSIDGSGRKYTRDLPELYIMQEVMSDVALDHIASNTGLRFTKTRFAGYAAQPTESRQIAALLMTYNFKTRYFNNSDMHNTLLLKFDHHVGFDVNTICFECVKANHIHVGDLKSGCRLAC